jgi:hypothetical protein
VGGIEKKRLGQSRQCATTIVGGDDGQPPPLKGTDIKRELPNPNFRGFPLRQWSTVFLGLGAWGWRTTELTFWISTATL